MSVLIVLTIVACGYALSLRLSRERYSTQLVLGGEELWIRRRKRYFGLEWTTVRYKIELVALKAIRRSNRLFSAERIDGRIHLILECATESQAEWLSQQIADRLTVSQPNQVIHWTVHDGSLVAEPRFLPPRYAPWTVTETHNRLEIELPAPIRTPLGEFQSWMARGMTLLKIGRMIAIISLITIFSIQILARLLPSGWLEPFLNVLVIPYLTLAFSIIITFLTWKHVNERRRELPAKTEATRHITTRLIADQNGLTRINALNEVEFFDRTRIERIELQLEFGGGEDFTLYIYTLSLLLTTGQRVILLVRSFDDEHESRVLIIALVNRMEQTLALPAASTPFLTQS